MGSSGSHRLFEQMAEELIDKLEKIDTEFSKRLLETVKSTLDKLKSWDTVPPTNEERVETIKKVIDISREVNEYVTNQH